MSPNVTLRNINLQMHNKHNFLLNLQIYNKKNFLLTITTIFFNCSLLMNKTDNTHGFLLNINVICAKSLYALTKCYFYMLIIKTV